MRWLAREIELGVDMVRQRDRFPPEGPRSIGRPRPPGARRRWRALGRALAGVGRGVHCGERQGRCRYVAATARSSGEGGTAALGRRDDPNNRGPPGRECRGLGGGAQGGGPLRPGHLAPAQGVRVREHRAAASDGHKTTSSVNARLCAFPSARRQRERCCFPRGRKPAMRDIASSSSRYLRARERDARGRVSGAVSGDEPTFPWEDEDSPAAASQPRSATSGEARRRPPRAVERRPVPSPADGALPSAPAAVSSVLRARSGATFGSVGFSSTSASAVRNARRIARIECWAHRAARMGHSRLVSGVVIALFVEGEAKMAVQLVGLVSSNILSFLAGTGVQKRARGSRAIGAR